MTFFCDAGDRKRTIFKVGLTILIFQKELFRPTVKINQENTFSCIMCLSQYQKSKMPKIKIGLYGKQKNAFLMISNFLF